MGIERRTSRCGLTLIEVILAISIMSLGLVVMLTAISRCLAVMKISENYHKAMWALSAGEVEFPLLLKPDSKPEDFEVDPQAYDGILYERIVDDPDEDSEDNEVRLLILTTKLSWQGRGREQVESIPRYLVYRK